MRVWFVMVALAACTHHDKPPAKPEPSATVPWDAASGQFLEKLATVMDAAQDDCARLVAGLKSLEPDAAELAHTLVNSGHELADYVQPAELRERFGKHPGLFSRCEAAKVDGFADAVTTTLFTVEPLKADRKVSAFQDIFVPTPQ